MLSKIPFVLRSALPLALLSSPLLLAAAQPTDLETYGVYCNESSAPTNSRPVSGSVQPVSTSRQSSTQGQVTSAEGTAAVWRDSFGRLSDRAATAVQLLMSNPYTNSQSSSPRSENGPSTDAAQNNQSNCLAATSEQLTVQNTRAKQAATSVIQSPQPLAELPDLGVSPIPELPAEPPVAESPLAEPPTVEPIDAETPAAETPVVEAAETPVVEAPTAETPVIEAPIAKPLAPEISTPETSVVESPVAESPVAESPVGESPAGAPPVAVPSAVELPVFEPPAVELPAVIESPAVESPAVAPPAAAPPAVEYPAVEPPSVEPSSVGPSGVTPPPLSTPSLSTEPSPFNQPSSLDPNNITPTTVDPTPFDGSVIATLASRPDGNYRYLSGEAEFRAYSDAELQQQGGSIFVLKKAGNIITGNLLPQIGQPGICVTGVVSGNVVTGAAYPYGTPAPSAESADISGENNAGEITLQQYGNDALVVSRPTRPAAGVLYYAGAVLDLSGFSMINAGISVPPSSCVAGYTVQ